MASSANQQLATLSAQKAKLLELLLQKKSAAAQRMRRYPRGGDAGRSRLPASWAQQRLWFFDQLQGCSAAYNIPVAMRLRGRLDEQSLRQALDALVRRHEILRTVFVSVGGEAHQEIAPSGSFALQAFDLTEIPEQQREAQVQLHRSDETQRPFDLHVGPLIRGRLLRLQPEEHVLLITMHHIVSDGWSRGIMIRELAELYAALQDGVDSSLSPLPIQYADYAQWQREWLQGDVLERQLRYWRCALEGATPQLNLPTDRPRPAVQSYQGQSVPVVLDARLSGQLKALAQRNGMTLFMVLHAAWVLLLSRLSGQEDIVVGTPVANRRRPEVEGLIGFFVNMLALRIPAPGELRLGELLERVKQVTLAAYDHQDMPFEHLVEDLKPERTLSRHPIFQVAFVLQNAPRSELRLPGLSVMQEEGDNDAAKFDLQLILQEQGEGIAGSVMFATDLFDRQTIERWTACLHTLLQSMTVAQHSCVGDLSILPEAEREQLIQQFNATRAPYPDDELLHQLFEEHARRAPEAIAVSYRDQNLSYAELNRRANQLARFLRAQGIGPDRLVGLCVERGMELVVGMLGVLKAGGAYLPLDPNYPTERLAYMLADATPTVLLTQAHLQSTLPETGALVVAIDAQWSEIATYEEQDIDAALLGLSPNNLANVIYTSGSTGLPKGVMVTHRCVCNLAMTQLRTLDVQPDSRVLQFASVSFDAFTWEWSTTLCAGACFCLAPREDLAPGEPLRNTLESRGITHAILAPIVLSALPSTEGLEALRTIVLGGEVVSESLAQRWAAGRCFINGYGPTETTVCASLHVCDVAEPGNPPIGKPLANTQIYILDSRRQPTPIGVAGEIYIAGAGVARGYLNRPALMAERFVANPFSDGSPSRMYKTGDVGRWLADGTIEYQGRNDHQVKVRGFRIELEEIEAQLMRHAQVKEAAVIAREDVPGDKRIVAYVVARDSGDTEGASVESLRTHLKAILPDYMVPSAIVMLERLPVTPNGKLDRRALPAPDMQAYVRRSYEEPQGPVEEIVAGIWQALLHVERVGRRDNFFELGGHSLLIVQMMERLRRLGLSAEVRSVFESPTLADLATALQPHVLAQFEVPPNRIPAECDEITADMLPLVELRQEEIERIVASVPGGAANIHDIYPLAPLQEGILFHHLLDETRGDAYVLPRVFVASSRQRLDDLIAALQGVIDRHEVLRTAILWEKLPRPVQVVYKRAVLPVAQAALSPERQAMEQIQEWIRPERQRLDIRRAPLMRLQIAMNPLDPDEWYALLQLHHMTIDHLALQIVTAEIVASLEGYVRLPAASSPYRNHVAQALAYAHEHDTDGFFRNKLGDIVEPTAPFGLLNVHGDGTQIEHARQQLEPVLAVGVRAEARRQGVSAATLFHAAWALVVAHTSARDDVVFGSVLLGRLQMSAGAQRTLGMFINTLPLRLRLRDVTAQGLVVQTQRELVELLSHEQASLAAAQRCSAIAGAVPLFSALLNFRHSVPNPAGDWASVTGIRALPGQERTNYPITVSVDDLGDGFGMSVLTDRSVDPNRIIAYLCTALSSLLDALEQSPQAPALTLPILPEGERRLVTETFNATLADYPREKVIHQLFEEVVQRAPDRTAVTHDGQSLTYAELNARANRLARWLRARGVGPGRLVAICIDRSPQMVVGMLGILKAGAAYVPLDPNYPPERLQHMLEDAEPSLVLTQRSLMQTLPRAQAEAVALDETWQEIAASDDANLSPPELELGSHHPVYVIYTSGSTGRPKGTSMPHRSMVNLIEWHRSHPRLGEPRRVLQFAALSFDVAFQEVFSTLCTGGTLVLLDECIRKDAPALLELLAGQSVERLFVPPLMLQSLAECSNSVDAPGLQLQDIITAGEQLSIGPEVVEFFGRLPSCQLHNHYGPTETHVVTTLTLAGDPRTWPALPTIGQPIANTQIYILDERLQPLALGVAGEIYIAGANVSLGYLHRADLTEARFLRDPFSSDPHARMYKTGDLGRWRADGALEYLGRNDDQVKIRGYRIELGEIEAELRRHLQVRDAAVVALADASGGKRLVAYFTGRDEIGPSVEDLRAHLKAALPDHMVPSAFVVLQSLPVTPTGKLNRRALPAPELSAYASNQYEPPQGELEQSLAEIWQQVLKVERIGRSDDFFNLGGHSLLALQALWKVNQAFGCTLRVTDFYKGPTVQAMAARIEGVAIEDAFVDLSREARLDARIVAQSGTLRVPAKGILLTGAAGFVGRFLLAQLLNDTDATIYCLLRARSKQHARSRLKATLTQWDLWRDEYESRIVAVPGDLRLPRLGLDEASYRVLAVAVDSIHHCATSMNHLETFAMAKAANVDSVAELLELATCERPKLVNYISTLGVFGAAASDPPRVIDETSSIADEKYRYSQGYLASKWVSEKIFMMAGDRGIPCNTFRLGLVWADAQEGRFDELQHVYRVMKSCLLSGYGIANFRYPMPPTPVDYVARAIVFLADRHPEGQGMFHIASADQRVDDVFERCNDMLGTALEIVPFYDWIHEIKRLHLAGLSLPAVPLIEYAFSMDKAVFDRHVRTVRSAANVSFDFSRTHRELESAGLAAPVLNDDLLRVCLSGMLSRDVELREWASVRQGMRYPARHSGTR